ncbi:hypothetical protein [Nocardioides bruguierae]|uniref:Uncharacterized protein n=1 Tax=Nocardioides bruguierae TaxID=2945102 RepID=A0A9X2DB84_9ACTN|nr:hypothetical protein [Nocardioides bruguierae]MCM0622187.1 hypothetical protein [Nocardioides bruguierae]
MADTTSSTSALYHGGIPGLRIGDLIEPGHARRTHQGCEYCKAREAGQAHNGIDGPSGRPDRVYATTHRLYAKHYASLWGRGDLYRVEPVGETEQSSEDSFETMIAPAFRVVSVYERAVALTMSERRRLYREWGDADEAMEWSTTGDTDTWARAHTRATGHDTQEGPDDPGSCAECPATALAELARSGTERG